MLAVKQSRRPRNGAGLKRLLLGVARLLPHDGWNLEDLAVMAARQRPDKLSMKGYPGYPCTKHVGELLQGRAGLLKLGLVERAGAKYRVTRKGRED